MLRSRRRSLAAAAVAALPLALLAARGGTRPVADTRSVALPPAHTLVVVLENHSYEEIVGNPDAPYINSLRAVGASFTDSHAVGHPSEPNYLALFAGTTEGLSDDSCPHTFSDPNLATALADAGLTFTGFSEDMPYDGYTGCDSGRYARKHNPWVDFANVPASENRAFAAFPGDFTLLPTVAFVVPDLCDDMHDCSVATGDAWLAAHLDGYVRWAIANDSLFVLTFDESDSPTNRITTIFVGARVPPGDRSDTIDHYGVVRAIEDLYVLPLTGRAADAPPIANLWLTPTPAATPTPVAPAAPLRLVLPGDHPLAPRDLLPREAVAPTPTPTPIP